MILACTLGAGETAPDAPNLMRLLGDAELVESVAADRLAAGAAQAADRQTGIRVYRMPGSGRCIRIEETTEIGADGKRTVIRAEPTAADQLSIAFRPGTGERQMEELARSVGGRVTHRIPSLQTAVIRLASARSDAVTTALAIAMRSPLVRFAERDGIVLGDATPNDPYYASAQQSLPAIAAPTAWNVTTGSANVVVAVIDSGVMGSHPDLAANMWTNPGEAVDGLDNDGDGLIDDRRGWDWVGVDADPADEHGHGTHCAGIIGARGNNGVGISGVCWDVRIMPLRVLNASNWGYYSDWAAAMVYAVQHGASILSMSLGGVSSSTVLQSAVDQVGAAGGLIVVSAGNDGAWGCQYPAACTGDAIISIAASNALDAPTSWTNRHATLVDLAAPGDAIYSTYVDGTYRYMSGTSMAAPHVTGACALIKAYQPSWTGTQIRAAVLAGVDVLPAWSGLCATGGRLNLKRSLQQAGAFFPGNSPPEISGSTDLYAVLDEDGTWQVQLTASDPDHDIPRWAIGTPGIGRVTVTANDASGGTCTIVYSPLLNFYGPDSFTITATDGAMTDSVLVHVDVRAINDPPVCTRAPAITGSTAVGGTLVGDDGEWDDPHDPVPSIILFRSWEQADDDAGTNLRDVPSSWGSSSHLVVAADRQTWLRIRIMSNGALPTVAYSPWVPIPGLTNSPPLITTSPGLPIIAWEDQPISMDIAACDVDLHALAWSATVGDGIGTVQLTGTGWARTLTFTPAPDAHGDAEVVVTVDDGHGGLDSLLIALTVTPLDDAPVLDVPATSLRAVIARPFDFSFPPGSAVDADGDELTWISSDLPAWLTQDPANGNLHGTPAAEDAGETDSYIWVFANGQTSAVMVLHIHTGPDEPPQLAAATLTIQAETGRPFTYVFPAGSAVDADGDAITWHASGLPGWLSMAPAGGTLSGTPSADDAGDTNATFWVEANGLASSVSTLRIEVERGGSFQAVGGSNGGGSGGGGGGGCGAGLNALLLVLLLAGWPLTAGRMSARQGAGRSGKADS